MDRRPEAEVVFAKAQPIVRGRAVVSIGKARLCSCFCSIARFFNMDSGRFLIKISSNAAVLCRRKAPTRVGRTQVNKSATAARYAWAAGVHAFFGFCFLCLRKFFPCPVPTQHLNVRCKPVMVCSGLCLWAAGALPSWVTVPSGADWHHRSRLCRRPRPGICSPA